MQSSRLASVGAKDPIWGVGITHDNRTLLVGLPFYLFTDPILTQWVGEWLSSQGITHIGFGDPKMTNSGSIQASPWDPFSAIPGGDPFTGGALYLSIYTES